MFYSHEILTSRQYGVATIWLVATVGKGTSTKRVSKKAIQDVDVQKACGKIIEPGAPVALRLQGQLLYGVSSVYNQQCSYMLADLQRIQAHMHVFFTKFGHNQLDPEAGHTRPENLLIMNDPDFVPDMRLPQFDLDAFLAATSQGTNKTSSQMSPFRSSSSVPGFDLDFQLDRSDSSGPRGSPFGLQGLSSSQKPEGGRIHIHQDDEFAGAGNWGMDIDENGNIIELDEPAIFHDELELPPLPEMEGKNQEQANAEQHNQPNIDDQGDFIMMDEEPRPEAQALPERQLPDEHDPFQDDIQQHEQAPVRRKRKARVLHADEETQISRNTMREWQDNYLEYCATKKVRATGAARTKTNAMLLTFGLGLGNIGQNLGVPGMAHPLALEFSGDLLFTAFTGLDVPQLTRGKRRSATESIEDDEEQNERRVRPRLETDADQQGRSQQGDDIVMFDDDQPVHSSPEVGREAQAAMSDHLSSALRMPWNQGSSVHGSAQKGRIPSSPLGNRGTAQDVMRYSDDPSMDFGFDMGGLHSQDDDLQMRLGAGPEGEAQAQGEPKSPVLDLEGQNFFSFMETAVRDNGERRLDEDYDVNRRWVAFDDMFVPRETPRATAAQAFYHTLCLATKGKMEVEQDGEPNEPFGGIWVGLKL
ncbi:Rec8 like protein-domain-containing protein [Hypoxylon cercidicola]|nr:Rec8 like protein-domain-containing protein [Hypoxylon cercidicola]